MGFKRDGSSTLFVKIDKIITLFIDEINNDEEIKKLLVFLTRNPLEDRSVDYSGIKIYQNDLPSKINCVVTYTTSNKDALKKTTRTSKQILFSEPYQVEKINSEYPTIFVHNYSYDCRDTIGSNLFMIDILIPSMYLDIKTVGSVLIQSRLHRIMQRLAYLFDKVTLDSESAKELGNLEFKLVGIAREEKINKTNDITITTLSIETKLVNARTDGNKRIGRI